MLPRTSSTWTVEDEHIHFRFTAVRDYSAHVAQMRHKSLCIPSIHPTGPGSLVEAGRRSCHGQPACPRNRRDPPGYRNHRRAVSLPAAFQPRLHADRDRHPQRSRPSKRKPLPGPWRAYGWQTQNYLMHSRPQRRDITALRLYMSNNKWAIRSRVHASFYGTN